MTCFKVHSLSCCRFTLTFWLLPLIKHLHVLNSALRTVNPDVGDHKSGSLQMLLTLWSDCHFTFPARPTIQMFIDISHIHFETLSRFQSLDVQFRWCENVIKTRCSCVYVGRNWTDYEKMSGDKLLKYSPPWIGKISVLFHDSGRHLCQTWHQKCLLSVV